MNIGQIFDPARLQKPVSVAPFWIGFPLSPAVTILSRRRAVCSRRRRLPLWLQLVCPVSILGQTGRGAEVQTRGLPLVALEASGVAIALYGHFRAGDCPMLNLPRFNGAESRFKRRLPGTGPVVNAMAARTPFDEDGSVQGSEPVLLLFRK